VEARERSVQYYQLRSGACPFREWRDAIADRDLKAIIDARIARLRAGNFGDSKSVGEGVSEARIDVGPGYRVYYGVDGDIVILLGAGDKSTQDWDIQVAQGSWKDYKERTKQHAKKPRLQGGSSSRPKK